MRARLEETLGKFESDFVLQISLKWCEPKVGDCLQVHIKTNATAWGFLDNQNLTKTEKDEDLQIIPVLLLLCKSPAVTDAGRMRIDTKNVDIGSKGEDGLK